LSSTSRNPAGILIVSRDPSSLGPVWSLRRSSAWELEIAGSGSEALEWIQTGGAPALVFLDLPRGDNDGFYTLRWLRRLRPELPVILLAATDDAGQRADALRLGAQDYLVKPLEPRQLESIGSKYFGDEAGISPGVAEPLCEGMAFLAAGPGSQKLRSQSELLAQVDVPVLIVGESGSGKEATARLIHKLSKRGVFSFQKVNCAALSGELLERELFGYEPGAFPGATRSRAGKLELADKGTIFLDDISEAPFNLQAKLLQVLQDKELLRAGGENGIACDVRFMAASSADLEQALAERHLREELYYRLSAFTVQVPPLRQRAGEIPQLMSHFMEQLAAQYALPVRPFSRVILEACQCYSWPGNLRELEGLVKRYLVMGDEQFLLGELRRNFESSLAGEQLHDVMEEPASGLRSLVQTVKGEAEKNAIAMALEETRWNRKAAARLLKVSYRTVLYKIQQYHMSPPASQASAVSTPNGPRPKSLRSFEPEITEPSQ
jgi:DNA-binding NtrC family response regulator